MNYLIGKVKGCIRCIKSTVPRINYESFQKEYQRRIMEKEDFLSSHGREERNEEMRKLDSHQEHDHIIRSKVS